jgi:hypothetical protein
VQEAVQKATTKADLTPAPVPIAPIANRLENAVPKSQENEEGAPRSGVQSAYPTVQPMKAALYFDNADGFGEWRILISTKAEKKLRETRNKERATFDIIVNKIR